MKYLQSILIIIVIASSFSCRKDFTTVASFGDLQFSKDTVFLDTIFTNIGSSTYNLKVYNKSNKDITIPQISLENGTNSNYRLNVDGIPGKSFEDIDILANDSIYVFVETTIDFTTVPDPLYTDKILFDNGNNQQDVDLVTLVQDATFIFPGKDPVSMEIDNLSLDGAITAIQGRFLNDGELTFTNEKPYVIYGYAAVEANKTLIIEAGAKIYFHDNSGLIIDKEASLIVNGSLDEKVVFEGDRLENSFNRTAGQWGTIWMRAGSKNNEINHAVIKNSVIGFLVDSISGTDPTLKIQNTEIYNSANFGILGRETNIEGNNIVIGNAGESSFSGTIGGTYNFTHSTFANYWNNSIRSLPAVLINNFFTYEGNSGQEIIETRPLKEVNFTNCIIEGNNNLEFIIDIVDDGAAINYNVSNSLIEFNDINGLYTDSAIMNFEDTMHFQNIILNGNPDFKNFTNSEFIIGENSDAINNASSSTFTFDILEVDRTASPDIGAYQHIIFSE